MYRLCRRLRGGALRAPGDGTGGVKEFKLDPKSAKTLGQTVDSLIAALPQRYDDLAAELSASGLVKPSDVYLNQYPQFWYASATKLCDGQPSSPFPTQTWTWLASKGNKLNAAVSAAAAKYHWHMITVPAKAFYDHGYCRFRGSWFVPVTLGAYYNLAGAFHPTARGARVTAVQATLGVGTAGAARMIGLWSDAHGDDGGFVPLRVPPPRHTSPHPHR